MFGIGGTELICILIVALVVLGPEHLPKAMRTLGKTVGTLRRASTEFQRTLNTDLALEEMGRGREESKTLPGQDEFGSLTARDQELPAEYVREAGRKTPRRVLSPRLRSGRNKDVSARTVPEETQSAQKATVPPIRQPQPRLRSSGPSRTAQAATRPGRRTMRSKG